MIDTSKLEFEQEKKPLKKTKCPKSLHHNNPSLVISQPMQLGCYWSLIAKLRFSHFKQPNLDKTCHFLPLISSSFLGCFIGMKFRRFCKTKNSYIKSFPASALEGCAYRLRSAITALGDDWGSDFLGHATKDKKQLITQLINVVIGLGSKTRALESSTMIFFLSFFFFCPNLWCSLSDHHPFKK